jgi:Lhr-like helicase
MNTMIEVFNMLHPLVRQAVSRLGWQSLRFIQIAVINAYFASRRDLIVTAPTAAGKTEAIFLPGFSDILNERNASVRILYVSPLKALINDQHGRLEPIAKGLGIPVHAWHGDIDDGRKEAVRRKPEGVLVRTVAISCSATVAVCVKCCRQSCTALSRSRAGRMTRSCRITARSRRKCVTLPKRD